MTIIVVVSSILFSILIEINASSTNRCDSWQRPFPVDQTLFPFESNCLELTDGRIHYIDVRPMNVKPLATILAFHGNPVWTLIFSKLALKSQLNGFRFVAFDYFGYGMSDKPDPNEFDYKIRSQGRIAAEFIRTLNLTDFFVLVQDGGGPIGLSAAQEEHQRIKGFLIINTWFTATKPIVDGTTNKNFIFHDWSFDNLVNEKYFIATGFNSFNGASGTVNAWQLDPNSPEGQSLTRMILSPFFIDGNRSKPISSTVHLPHVRLVQSVLHEEDFYDQLESKMFLISSKPVYFLFADPLAFSSLRCDTGPRTRINLNSSDAIKYEAKQLNGTRSLCPTSFVCSDDRPKPFQSKCFDENQREFWHTLEDFLSIWSKDQIVGIFKDFPGHEYFSARSPETILNAIEALRNFTENNRTNSFSSSILLLFSILIIQFLLTNDHF